MNGTDLARAELTLTDTDAGLHCILAGRLDTERCGQISEALMERLQQSHKPLTFDLAEVSFVASSFLRLCIQAARIAGTGNVSLINTAPPIKKVFKIAGLDGTIRID